MAQVELHEVATPEAAELAAHLESIGAQNVRILVAGYRDLGFQVIVAREPYHEHHGGPENWRWHVSVSGVDRVPPWEAMSAIVHAVRPGVPFVMGIPPESMWMSVHPHTLHAWETKDEALVAEWRANGQAFRDMERRNAQARAAAARRR